MIRRWVFAPGLALALAGCGGGDPDSQSLDVHVNKAKPAVADDGGSPGVRAGGDAQAPDGAAAGQSGTQAGYGPGAIEKGDHPKIARDSLRPDAYAPDSPPGLEQVQEGGDGQATPQQ